eukprot:342381_1
MASSWKYPSPGQNVENKSNESVESNLSSKMDVSIVNAVAECQRLISMISDPLNEELKSIISKHAQTLLRKKNSNKESGNIVMNTDQNDDELLQKYAFTGYEESPDHQITAKYEGQIAFDQINGKISGHLQEKETCYAMHGWYDLKTNSISKLVTEPSGEYQHLNENIKHQSGHWDVCVWINGKIDFENKTLVCENQRFHKFREVLQWK